MSARHEADEVDETAVFDDSDDEQDAIDSANTAAPAVVDLLCGQFGNIRKWVYPHGTVCVTVAADHDAGLGIDASSEATDTFTVLRGWGEAQLQVESLGESWRAAQGPARGHGAALKPG